MFDGLGSSAAHIKGGRIKGLMVAGNKRVAAFPDVPAAAEVGLPGLHRDHLVRPVGAQGHAGGLQRACTRKSARRSSRTSLKAVWANQGAEFPNLTPAAVRRFIDSEVKRWAQVVKASNVKAD